MSERSRVSYVISPALLAELEARCTREQIPVPSAELGPGTATQPAFARTRSPFSFFRTLAATFRRSEPPPPLLEPSCEAFYLGFDFSCAVYLTRDGRLFWDFDEPWRGDGPRFVEHFGTGGAVGLVLGAKQTGIRALLDLIPPRPPDGLVCPQCKGTHRAPLSEGLEHEVICTGCLGVGWVVADVTHPSRPTR